MAKVKRGSLIGKIIFYVVELVGGLGLYVAVTEAWRMLTVDGEIFMSVLYAIVGLYVSAGFVLILDWLFNAIHRFNDFDGFGDMLASLSAAPLLLVKHILVHPLAILRQLLGASEPERKTSKSKASAPSARVEHTADVPVREISNQAFNARVEAAAKNITSYASPQTSYASGVYANWYHRPSVRVLGRTITVKGTVSFEATVPDGDIEEWVIDDCFENLYQEIEGGIERELKELCAAYGRDADSWSISCDLSYRT